MTYTVYFAATCARPTAAIFHSDLFLTSWRLFIVCVSIFLEVTHPQRSRQIIPEITMSLFAQYIISIIWLACQFVREILDIVTDSIILAQPRSKCKWCGDRELYIVTEAKGFSLHSCVILSTLCYSLHTAPLTLIWIFNNKTVSCDDCSSCQPAS